MPFEAAPFGVTGLETAFAALYTHLVEPGLLRSRRCSSGCRPARADLRPRAAADRGRRAGEPRRCSTCRRDLARRPRRLPLALGELLAARRDARGKVRLTVADGAGGVRGHDGRSSCSRTARSSAASPSAPTGYAFGEAVFTTAMTGYQEVVTDPSYAEQLVCFTAPMVGNYGVAPARRVARRPREGRDHARGARARSGRTGSTTAAFVALTGIDTRSLVQQLREADRCGRPSSPATARSRTRRCEPSARSRRWKAAHSSPRLRARAVRPGTTAPAADRGGRLRVQALDPRRLAAGRRAVTVVYPHERRRRACSRRPDGVLLSNGPGDPSRARSEVEEVRELLGRVPVARHLPRPPAARARDRPRDVQAPLRPPRRQPPGARAGDRPRARHEPEPRLRGRAERRGGGDARLALRRHRRGPRLPASTVPARCSSIPRPARARTTPSDPRRLARGGGGLPGGVTSSRSA